jgi:putative lipoprotein (rSAM/lipoprotein system)
MKILKRKVIKGTNWALAGLMTLLGFGCGHNGNSVIFDEPPIDDVHPVDDIRVEYGSPHAAYKLMGIVRDEQGNVLKGIRVIVPELNNCTKVFDYNKVRIERNDTLLTDDEGSYNYQVNYWEPNDSLQIKLKVEDPAGKYETQNDSVKYSFSELEEGTADRWLLGVASKEKDFVLKEKSDHE